MTAAEHFISLVTVASAKKIAATLVICFILYHGMIHLIYGSDSCRWLLKEGRYKGDKEWQPYGCMIHHYTQTDSRRCLRYLAFMRHKNHFVFIGDARIHQLYKSFISQFIVDGKGLDSTNVLQQSNSNFDDAKLKLQVQFLWRPQLNISMINDFQAWMVLFRLNLLTVLLCLLMNQPYQFYHFVPLVSFWFLIVYILAWIPPRVYSGSLAEYGSRALLYLALKLLGLIFVITILYMSEVFFEKVFVTRPWKALFVTTDDDIREWWSRWRVDRYSVAFGVAFGAGLLALQRIDHIPGNVFIPLIALVSLAAYTAFTLLCVSISECEEIHSYIVFIPIIAYIILRNSSFALRGKYSVLLAGIGKISLETLVGQGHVWLAADTHGVLVLLPRFPVLNLLITSFIFICASHEIHELTLILAPYAVPNNWKLVARNLLVFTAILVPIGIHDGMF